MINQPTWSYPESGRGRAGSTFKTPHRSPIHSGTQLHFLVPASQMPYTVTWQHNCAIACHVQLRRKTVVVKTNQDISCTHKQKRIATKSTITFKAQSSSIVQRNSIAVVEPARNRTVALSIADTANRTVAPSIADTAIALGP